MKKYVIADYPEGATMIPQTERDKDEEPYYLASEVDARIAELEADLATFARSGCKIRIFNGERYVEITNSSTD